MKQISSENKIRVEDSINIFKEHIVDIANIFKINMNILSKEYSEFQYERVLNRFIK